MEFSYYPQEINARMGLEEALKAYSDEIKVITLRDGTNIEIISNDQCFRNRPEICYTYDEFQNEEENDNDFIEENIEDNYNQYNYQQISPNKQVVLRGKGLGKSLRKTVLKSIDGKEKEKEFENGKLRNLAKKNVSPNSIIQFTENNDFLQCANCHKFFCSDEKEESQIKPQTTEKTTQNNQNIPPNSQKLPLKPQQKGPYPQQFQPYPQKPSHHPPQQMPPHHRPQQPPHQQGPQFPQHPQQKQKIPQNMNMNMGFPQKPNYPQGFQGQNKPGPQNQFYQQKNIHGGFPGFNQQMGKQFRGNNQVFRARRKEINDYEMDYEDYDDDNIKDDNYITEEIYLYPSSAKKYRSEKKIHDENLIHKKMSHNIENLGLTRNLSFGYKKNAPNQEFGYTDNNLNEFINMNDNEYYDVPKYNKRNMIPTGRTKKANNHRVVDVKVTRNTPYEYQEYEDYEDYINYDN